MNASFCAERQTFNFKKLLIIFLIIAVFYAVADHAFRRHGDAVNTVNNLCDTNNLGSFFNPTTGRKADTCFDPVSQKYGARIWNKDGDTIITSFFRSSAKKLDDLVNYLISSGYTQ
jgi:hypothetical protein